MKIVFKDFIFLNDIEIKDILELRNKRYIRENMKAKQIISFEKHINFVNSLKNIANKKYFAIFCENELLGSVNFINEEDIIWGLYFKDGINPILKSCLTYIFLDFLFKYLQKDINSFVKKINLQALNFNKNFGFKFFKEDEEYIYLRLSSKNWENHKNSRLLKPIKKYLDKIEYEFK